MKNKITHKVYVLFDFSLAASRQKTSPQNNCYLILHFLAHHSPFLLLYPKILTWKTMCKEFRRLTSWRAREKGESCKKTVAMTSITKNINSIFMCLMIYEICAWNSVYKLIDFPPASKRLLVEGVKTTQGIVNRIDKWNQMEIYTKKEGKKCLAPKNRRRNNLFCVCVVIVLHVSYLMEDLWLGTLRHVQ